LLMWVWYASFVRCFSCSAFPVSVPLPRFLGRSRVQRVSWLRLRSHSNAFRHMAPGNAAEAVGSDYVTPNAPMLCKLRQLLACVLERAYAGMRSCSPVPDDGKERMKARWPTVVQVNAVKRSGCYQTVSLICNVIKCVFVFVHSA
jgi:hypothetical protein